MNTKYIYTAIVIALFSLNVLARSGEVEIGGITYEFATKGPAACVIAPIFGQYSGDIVIPSAIVVDGVECKVTDIARAAFQYSDVTSVTIPGTIRRIWASAFADCKKLKSVHIDDLPAWCRIEFGDNPFEGSPHRLFLNDVEIVNLAVPVGITRINAYAFSQCMGLASVTHTDGITSIGKYAFHDCIGLTSVSSLDKVRDIGSYAFSGCTRLSEFALPEGITIINQGVLKGCSSLTSITVPDGVTTIKDEACRGCSSLKTLSIGESVKEIGRWAFAYCPDLMDVFLNTKCNILSDSNYGPFDESFVQYAILHLPTSEVERYGIWNFGTVVEYAEKCATPTMTYENGQLVFHCETDGAGFVSEITATDLKENHSDAVGLSATYNIKVHAVCEGYENSDKSTGTLCWLEMAPQTVELTEGDSDVPVNARHVLCQVSGERISISGVPAGVPVSVYDHKGRLVSSAMANDGDIWLSAGSGTEPLTIKVGRRSIAVQRTF